jgi:hypothetical protein
MGDDAMTSFGRQLRGICFSPTITATMTRGADTTGRTIVAQR